MKTLWRLRAQLLPALLFAAVPLVFLAAIAWFRFSIAEPEAQQAREETIASFQTLRAASAVDQAVQDAERGQRGFLLTLGRENYLGPYLDGKARLPRLMAELQRALHDNPDQQDRLLSLQANVTTKMNELESTIVAFRASGPEGARAIVLTDLGRAAMDAIDADLNAIVEAETVRLSNRQRDAAAAERRSGATFLLGGLAAAVALLAGAALLATAYRRVAISEVILQSTLDNVREGVAAFDGNGRLRAWNSPFARLLDLAPAALKHGQPLAIDGSTSLTATEIVGRIGDLDATARRTGRPALVSYHRRSGQSLELFHNRVADGYVTTVLDVSDQRQAEEALRQAQKLESVGQMTGGVAHDFNNLLTIVMGALGFLRRSVGGDARALERIDMLEIAAERGARLTKQLLAFARRQPLQPETINLGGVMQEILPLVRRAVGEEIVVECVGTAGLWNTTIDAAQFQSAVLNLAINSRHAMPNGGKLTIEVGNAALDDVYAARHAEVEPGQYVQFAITDTGAGMDAATLARAMDPFFTTRPAGEGSGLGLAQVYGFVKQSGGHIKIYSEPGEGTTVKLYLPRSLHEAAPVAPRTTNLAVTGSETILLVDDDEVVRNVVAAMLEELGYRVLNVADGNEALAVLEREPAVALLFTDVVMPGMSGRQLAERAVKIRPTLRVLFTSGYTQNAIVHNGRLDVGVDLISKPYDRDQLAAKVRRVLDASGQKSSNSQYGA
jgi:signal transduction histidine kinase/ActR/RegA family two-component response regulator